jgi:hypothetical protein
MVLFAVALIANPVPVAIKVAAIAEETILFGERVM